MATTQQKEYSVGGVMMPRPFKIRRLGHFGFNVNSPKDSLTFYRDLLGFKISDHIDFKANPQRAEMLKDVTDAGGYFMHHDGTITLSSCSPNKLWTRWDAIAATPATAT